ncbi:hypothetical protein RJ55_06662 [Drechmeria coniospora]|nr:hypothetical protein RJ55_06662 [Drechmeria coniospora]
MIRPASPVQSPLDEPSPHDDSDDHSSPPTAIPEPERMTTLAETAPEAAAENSSKSRGEGVPSPHLDCRRRALRIPRPARDSIYDILHEHAGRSLFVRPIFWTDLHAKLLGVRFHELPSCDAPSPISVAGSPPSNGHMRPSQTITTLSNALTEILVPAVMHPILASHAVKSILSTLWPEPFSKPVFLPELHLFFKDRVYRDVVRAQVMWNHPSDEPRSSDGSFQSTSTRPADTAGGLSTPAGHNPANLPMMCYIAKNQLAVMRKHIFRIPPGPGRSLNEPVFRLQQMRSRALTPANADHDVQFVAIFLAMAQHHFYPRPASSWGKHWSSSAESPPQPHFQDIKLRILTHDCETAEFIVYTGHVPAKLLERFHCPSNACRLDDGSLPGVRIEYTRVPIWPILGLRERLGKAFGEEVVGPFDPTVMQSWEVDEGDAEPQDVGKRKREALSEVFNRSFDDDSGTEEDEHVGVGVKRRCLAGSSVSVVA